MLNIPGAPNLNDLRIAFKIPESVAIRVLPRLGILKSNVGKPNDKYKIDQTDNTDPELYKSVLGTPVYSNIEFLAGEYETNTKGVFKQYGPMRFDAVLLTVNQAKRIVKTAIEGKDGNVKEYIGKDDYVVQINGIITGANGQHPGDDIAALKRILDAPVELEVAGAYLTNLDISLLVVESYEIGQEPGGRAYQTFSISCVSDIPQELRLTNV